MNVQELIQTTTQQIETLTDNLFKANIDPNFKSSRVAAAKIQAQNELTAKTSLLNDLIISQAENNIIPVEKNSNPLLIPGLLLAAVFLL